MTVGAALAVIVAGLLIGVFLSSTIGGIVAIIGVIGLVLALVQSMGARRTRV